MKISIFGLGYVGAVSLACLARDGHDVTGVDIDASKLDLIRQGHAPVIEEGLGELIGALVGNERIRVVSDAAPAIASSDLSFICVGTPSRPNGRQDLSAVEKLSREIGLALASRTEYHVVVVRSTVPPGTVESVVAPLLEEYSGSPVGDRYGLCFQPEFLREGSSVRDYDNPPYTVVGGDSPRSIERVRDVFGHLPCEFIGTDISTAEMLKYACNSFHALKVVFANEIGRISHALDVDPRKVMDLLCRDTSLNISPAYLRPGFAFGGSCLPKDLKSLLHVASSADEQVPVLSAILSSNRLQVERAIDAVLANGRKSVGMIGLSFKSGTDDLRESPLVLMAEHFIGKGLSLRIYDPEVNVSRLIGANRRYIEESIPHLASLMADNCRELIEESEILVVGLHDPPLMREIHVHNRQGQKILDLVGIPRANELRAEYHGICW